MKPLLSVQKRQQRYRAVVWWRKMIRILIRVFESTQNLGPNQRKIRKNYLSKFFTWICIFKGNFTKFIQIFTKSNIYSTRFSPCTSKPIKQRVEAFEKLQTPQKETRTRARVLLNADSEVWIIEILTKIHLNLIRITQLIFRSHRKGDMVHCCPNIHRRRVANIFAPILLRVMETAFKNLHFRSHKALKRSGKRHKYVNKNALLPHLSEDIWNWLD